MSFDSIQKHSRPIVQARLSRNILENGSIERMSSAYQMPLSSAVKR